MGSLWRRIWGWWTVSDAYFARQLQRDAATRREQELQARITKLEEVSRYDLASVLNLREELRRHHAILLAIVEAQQVVRVSRRAIDHRMGLGDGVHLCERVDGATGDLILTLEQP